MQDGAIVHLTEDGMQKRKVWDDHVHTLWNFEGEGCFFIKEQNFEQ